MEAQVNGETPAPLMAPATITPNPPKGRDESGRFTKGYAGGPGRPKKGESMPEKLRKRVERDADKVVDAVMRRLTRDDAVGNRAFSDVRDTVYGIPKQTLVLERGEDPYVAMMQAIAAANPIYIEESTTTTNDSTAHHDSDGAGVSG